MGLFEVLLIVSLICTSLFYFCVLEDRHVSYIFCVTSYQFVFQSCVNVLILYSNNYQIWTICHTKFMHKDIGFVYEFIIKKRICFQLLNKSNDINIRINSWISNPELLDYFPIWLLFCWKSLVLVENDCNAVFVYFKLL